MAFIKLRIQSKALAHDTCKLVYMYIKVVFQVVNVRLESKQLCYHRIKPN